LRALKGGSRRLSLRRPQETQARQIDLICAPQRMSAKRPTAAPNGGSVCGALDEADYRV
jgi:hypothetical protein